MGGLIFTYIIGSKIGSKTVFSSLGSVRYDESEASDVREAYILYQVDQLRRSVSGSWLVQWTNLFERCVEIYQVYTSRTSSTDPLRRGVKGARRIDTAV